MNHKLPNFKFIIIAMFFALITHNIYAQDCANPIEILSDTILTGQSTNGVDSYNAGPCGIIESAPDIVYSYTPATNEEVELVITNFNFSGFFANFYLSDACNEAGACIITEFYLGADTVNLSAILEGGTTYYFVVSGENGFVGPVDIGFDLELKSTPITSFIPGSNCEFPLEIESLPFEDIEMTTAGFGNLHNNVNPCNFSALTGEEKVYSYTPTEDVTVLIEVENPSSLFTLSVFDACPEDENASCLAHDASSIELVTVDFSAGTTYYIAISNLFNQISTGDLIISEAPSCTPPFELSASGFTTTSANLEFQSLTEGGTYEIEIGETNFQMSGTPTITGITENSYTWNQGVAGTEYDFYVRRNCGDDGISEWEGPFTFLTSPINDEICDAIELEIGAELVLGSIVNANPDTIILPACFSDTGFGLDFTNGVWYKFTPTAEQLVFDFEFVDGFGRPQMAVLLANSGTCDDDLAEVFCTNFATDTVINGLTPGKEHFILFEGFFGLSNDFNIGLSECVSSETIFEFTCDINAVGEVSETFVNTQGCDSIVTIITQIGDDCCTTPEHLYATDIIFTRATLGWDDVPAATRYRVQGRIANFSFGTRTRILTEHEFRTNNLFPFLTYEFRAQADCGEGWTDYSDWFQFTLNPFNQKTTTGNNNARVAQKDSDLKELDLFDTDKIFIVYPTVSAGDLNVAYNGEDLASSSIRVTDLSGRTVFANDQFELSNGNHSSLDLSHLANGQYFIQLIKDGIELDTKKIILSK